MRPLGLRYSASTRQIKVTIWARVQVLSEPKAACDAAGFLHDDGVFVRQQGKRDDNGALNLTAAGVRCTNGVAAARYLLPHGVNLFLCGIFGYGGGDVQCQGLLPLHHHIDAVGLGQVCFLYAVPLYCEVVNLRIRTVSGNYGGDLVARGIRQIDGKVHFFAHGDGKAGGVLETDLQLRPYVQISVGGDAALSRYKGDVLPAPRRW